MYFINRYIISKSAFIMRCVHTHGFCFVGIDAQLIFLSACLQAVLFVLHVALFRGYQCNIISIQMLHIFLGAIECISYAWYLCLFDVSRRLLLAGNNLDRVRKRYPMQHSALECRILGLYMTDYFVCFLEINEAKCNGRNVGHTRIL